MTIQELIDSPTPIEAPCRPERADPLRHTGGVQEANLVNVSFDAAKVSLALLFDARTSLQFRHTSVVVILCRDILVFKWGASMVSVTRRPSPTVIGSFPQVTGGVFRLEILFVNSPEIAISARSANSYACRIPGLPEIPSLEDSITYTSQVEILHTSTIE